MFIPRLLDDQGNPRRLRLLGVALPQGRHGAKGLVSLLILRPNQLNQGSQRRLCQPRAATRRRRHGATTHECRRGTKAHEGHLTHRPSQLQQGNLELLWAIIVHRPGVEVRQGRPGGRISSLTNLTGRAVCCSAREALK
jgi:hypothetical protein